MIDVRLSHAFKSVFQNIEWSRLHIGASGGTESDAILTDVPAQHPHLLFSCDNRAECDLHGEVSLYFTGPDSVYLMVWSRSKTCPFENQIMVLDGSVIFRSPPYSALFARRDFYRSLCELDMYTEEERKVCRTRCPVVGIMTWITVKQDMEAVRHSNYRATYNGFEWDFVQYANSGRL